MKQKKLPQTLKLFTSIFFKPKLKIFNMKNYILLVLFLTFNFSFSQTTYTVINGNDSGVGSLRQAIIDANTSLGADTINFSNALTIVLNSSLPTISTGDLIIDGTTVSGYSGTPLIEINKSGSTFLTSAMSVNNVSNFTMKGINIATSDTAPTGSGIGITNCTNLVLQDNVIKNHIVGVWIQASVTNAIVTGNDLTASGIAPANSGSYALRLAATGNVDIRNNIWGGGLKGLLIESTTNPITVHNTYNASLSRQVVLEDNSGFHDYSETCLRISFSTNVIVEGLKLSKTLDREGTGIAVLGAVAGPISITNCDIQGRNTSIHINSNVNNQIVDYTITGNNFYNSGGNNGVLNPAVFSFQNAFRSGHVTMHSNTWGGPYSIFGLWIHNSSDLLIGDENVANADIVIEDNSGFNTYGAVGGFNAGYNLKVQGGSNNTIDGLDVSRTSLLGTSLWLVSCSNTTVDNTLFNKGNFGIDISNSLNTSVTNSTFSNMQKGIFLGGTSAATVAESNFGCILIFAIDNNTSSSVNAQNNFWEDASGPTNLGGTGETLDGIVDATGFLTSPAISAPNGAALCPALTPILDSDGDGVNDVDDNCPDIANADQTDNDGDGMGDICDDDDDNDGILDVDDNCPLFTGEVTIGDLTPTPLEFNGPAVSMTNFAPTGGAAPYTVQFTTLGAFVGSFFVSNPTTGVDPTDVSTWPQFIANENNVNGQFLSNFLNNPNTVCYNIIITDSNGCSVQDVYCLNVDPPANADSDGDGINDDEDNCPDIANADQANNDGDGLGDICDDDDDNDGVLDVVDNCVVIANSNQLDSDGDGMGDVCDICPMDADNDIDGDGVCGDIDNCPTEFNEDQADSDCDGVGDVCDVCPGGDDSVDNNNDGIADCSQVLTLDEYSDAWKCGNKNDKIILCHIPPGNPSNVQTICISVNAIASHVRNHGCFVGPCVECTDEDRAEKDYEAEDPSAFSIYPNPTEYDFNVDITDLDFTEARLNIYDMNMVLKSVIQITESNRNNVMNLTRSNMSPGVYFVVISTNENSYVKRLVIK
jgi:hypothetical protein